MHCKRVFMLSERSSSVGRQKRNLIDMNQAHAWALIMTQQLTQYLNLIQSRPDFYNKHRFICFQF